MSVQFFGRLGLGKFHLIGQSLWSMHGVHHSSVHPGMVETLTFNSQPGRHTPLGDLSHVCKCKWKIELDFLLTEFGCAAFWWENFRVHEHHWQHQDLGNSSVPNSFLPQPGKEFEDFPNVVLCQPRWMLERMVDGFVILMINKYPVFKKSKCRNL